MREVVGDGPIEFEHTKRLTFIRNIFRETLRLYPPITFLPRIANEATMLGETRVRRGALIMVAPWVLHRHRATGRTRMSSTPTASCRSAKRP